MSRSDHAEVTAVERRDDSLPEPLADRDDAHIRPAEWQIRIDLHQLGRSNQVRACERFDADLAAGDRAEEACLGFGTKLSADEVCRLGDDERRRSQLGGGLKQCRAGEMVRVSLVGSRYEDAGIDEQRCRSRPNPSASISSASDAARPDLEDPMPTKLSLRRVGRSIAAGSDAARSSTTASMLSCRRSASARNRATTSGESSSVTDMTRNLPLSPHLPAIG